MFQDMGDACCQSQPAMLVWLPVYVISMLCQFCAAGMPSRCLLVLACHPAQPQAKASQRPAWCPVPPAARAPEPKILTYNADGELAVTRVNIRVELERVQRTEVVEVERPPREKKNSRRRR
jgi:hypothetical protein